MHCRYDDPRPSRTVPRLAFCLFDLCFELVNFAVQLHINLGLDKLRETQAGVEDMQKGLAEKERRLRCGMILPQNRNRFANIYMPADARMPVVAVIR